MAVMPDIRQYSALCSVSNGDTSYLVICSYCNVRMGDIIVITQNNSGLSSNLSADCYSLD